MPPSSTFTLSASPATVAPNGAVTASWTAPAGQTSALDWIGLYVVGLDDSTEGLNPSSNRTWQYTGGSTSGSLYFAAPASSGAYEFRYFLNNSSTRVATSNTVTVGSTPPPPATGNLIQDPDFENQTATGGGPLVAPWEGDGPATIGVDRSNGMNGSKCGYIYDDGSGAVSLISQVVAVSPNTNYTLSCFVQTGSAFPAQGGMGVKDGNWNILGNQSFGQMSDYTQLTVTFNSGSNTSVWVYVGFQDQGAGAWIHADNWSMK
jgi:hypothetical protein